MAEQRVELVNVEGRAALAREGRVIDVERRSGGRFGADPMQALEAWPELVSWARGVREEPGDPPLDPAQLGPCVPRPRQVFAIGLNYRDHAGEAALPLPAQPMVFTKFASCLAGPRAEVMLGSDHVDWEVELVVVIGARAHRVAAGDALQHVAGYCVGQDLSDREVQFRGVPPQFSLAKSPPGYGPIGPALVERDAVRLEALELTCDLNGERVQHGRVSDMVFSVPVLIEYLSQHCELLPGDLIFTGTPSGAGIGRKPPRFLRAGDRLHSAITGLGALENRCARGGERA